MEQDKPVYKIREGTVHVAVWKNESKEFGVSYSVTVQRRYCSKADDQWHSTPNLFSKDVLVASHLLTLAYNYIKKQEVKE